MTYVDGKPAQPCHRNTGEASGLTLTLGLRTSEEVARLYTLRTGEPITPGGVRMVLARAHAKIAKAISRPD